MQKGRGTNMGQEKTYIAIDLKSFYASVECHARGLDPLSTHLVVADSSRTEKTICLAVSPSLKAYGIPGRARLFEVVQRIRAVNAQRARRAPFGRLTGKSHDAHMLAQNDSLAVDYVVAPPAMASYMAYSARIYEIYLKYIAPEDIHVYSIDEVFIDATAYLTGSMTGRRLARQMIADVLRETGITATAGIGPNLYLAKVAMDIMAKKMPSDEDGVCIAELDEMSYRKALWTHRPITDFWRVGRGYARTLEKHGIYTMGDVARCSLGGPNTYPNEALLYRLFGVNAELLIDHAWGYEPCTMQDIKSYHPESESIHAGQVLPSPYDFEKARLVTTEMADAMALELAERRVLTDQLVLTVGYDVNNLTDGDGYAGEIKTDYYGRSVPKEAHGTVNLGGYTSLASELMRAVRELYERIVTPGLWVRRIALTANHLCAEGDPRVTARAGEQISFFDAPEDEAELAQKRADAEREKQKQAAVIAIKRKFGKNAILRGMSLEEGATAKQRNGQIGGHKA